MLSVMAAIFAPSVAMETNALTRGPEFQRAERTAIEQEMALTSGGHRPEITWDGRGADERARWVARCSSLVG